MKKWLLITLSILVISAMVLGSCGEPETTTPTTTAPTTSTPTTEPTTEPGPVSGGTARVINASGVNIMGYSLEQSPWDLFVLLCAVEKLIEYKRLVSRIFSRPKTPSFFVSERGTRLTHWSVRYTFVKLSREIGLRAPQDSHGPRLHDIRHTFAIKTLIRWYQTGMDVEHHIPKLATYLGHKHVNDTYWYISAVPELLNLATKRLDTIPGGALS